MQTKRTTKMLKSGILAFVVALSATAYAQKNVLQPGDPIIASSANSPGSEGVANAIDGKPTKYLNFDTDADIPVGLKPSGFVVTPSIGVTRVIGIALQSANDAADRDPKTITIEGSNDAVIGGFNNSTNRWELITKIDTIPAFTARFQTQTLFFDNFKAYKSYRWTVLATQGPSTCCMQIAEVQLLGGLLPQDVTQPGDPVIASSANSPGSEGVANVIDGKPTKYLNFDTDADIPVGLKPSGFTVSPALGKTLVTGITMTSANDAADRDPKVVTLEGSNDAVLGGFNASTNTWVLITTLSNVPPFTARFQTQTFLFDNVRPFRHYRWTTLQTQGPSTCCMQISEVELLGTGAPTDVTQPGDAIIASSANSPGSEGVANAIDGKPTKYLNFDTDADIPVGLKPSGFVVTPSIGATTIIGLSMQSANDAADRDPKTVTIEGSNDAQIVGFNSSSNKWDLITTITVPAYTARFQTQEFYFANNKSYKSYRWTVQATQGPSTCCMQIAEVEFLAVTEGADCNKAQFLVQPVETPVLSGSTATFVTTVNGPWPLQWYKNGEPIPGATLTSYTTDPVTAANATNTYSVKIVGCEMSSIVKAAIFTPSAVKSIGVNFIGQGANGTPTSMRTNDITGLQPQAFWNNTANTGSGVLPDPNGTTPFTDSDNKESTIYVEWQSNGAWGAGTGDATATQRMLNGLIYANAGTTANVTFGNVPDGTHSIIAYIVNIPLQFQQANFWVTGQTSQTNYIRSMNADEYNAAPGFYRGASTDPNNRTVASYVRFDNVRPSGGIITLSWDTLPAQFDRGSALNAVQLILNSSAAGAPPVITADPQPTVGATNTTVSLSVTATGSNLTYQWRKNGRNLPNGGGVSGANAATLSISGLSDVDEGVYSVAVFNAGGSTISKNASLSISKFDILDRLAGYWKFDETSGATAANAVAGGRPGSVKGAATWSAGQVANALGFDGASTYVFVDDYTKAVKSIAVSGWVKVNPGTAAAVNFIRNGEGQFRRPGDGNPAPVGQFELGLNVDANDGSVHLTAAIQTGPNIPRATAPTAFPLGTWQHVAFSADGAQLRLYINGALVATTDYTENINAPAMKHLSIGGMVTLDAASSTIDLDPADARLLPGQIDDLALWTRGLTANEVSQIFTAGKAGQGATTVKVTVPPVGTAPGKLQVSFSAGNVSITWDNGKLQSAAAANGPWTDVANATSPFREAASQRVKFYRTVTP
jgi:hypothetical protein